MSVTLTNTIVHKSLGSITAVKSCRVQDSSKEVHGLVHFSRERWFQFLQLTQKRDFDGSAVSPINCKTCSGISDLGESAWQS